MDDASQNKNLETNISRKSSNSIINDGDVFQSIWVRLSIQNDIRFDEFLLDYGRNFLPRVGFIFFIIYFIQKIF